MTLIVAVLAGRIPVCYARAMNHQPDHIIPLWPAGCAHNVTDEPQSPRIEVWMPVSGARKRQAALIVCPGGGYRVRAPHEGAPVARLAAARGFVGCVLHYRVAPHRHPLPLSDGCRAVRMARSVSRAWGIDPERVAMMGFSAGAHLAATVATQPDLYRDPYDDLAARFEARPDRLVLAYPVISMVTNYHMGCVECLLGDNPAESVRRQLSNELHVTNANPPVFLFHTSDDEAVPVDHSLMFARACWRQRVPIELHVFAHGQHGVGLAETDPVLKRWPELMWDWLERW